MQKVEGAELAVLQTIDWSTFRFGVLIIEIPCWHDDTQVYMDHNSTRALLAARGYSYLGRKAADELWGDLSVPWVRHGARQLRQEPLKSTLVTHCQPAHGCFR